MRLLAALLLLAACSKPLPAGVERLASARDAQSFRWCAQARRLAYVEGHFPDRTYLVIHDLGGRTTRRRLKGYVLGAGAALSRDGRHVLLDAGKIGRYLSRNEPTERALLEIGADDGAVLSETPLGPGGAVALGHPAWSSDPVAVWNAKDGLRWKTIGSSETGGVLRGPAAWRALLLDEPYLVVSEKQSQRPRMIVYDLRTNEQTAEWRVALTAVPLAVRPDGSALSARWLPETGRFALEAGDPKTGRRSPLLETDGEIETAIETDRGVFAIAKDPTRKNTSGKDFLAPRTLVVLETGGRQWSVPWTSHRGEFFGADPANRRLMFAVTDRDDPGAWAIEPTPAALTAAGRAIDER